MSKNFTKTLFYLVLASLISCSSFRTQNYFIENCADIQTSQFWEKKAQEIKEQILIDELTYKNSNSKSEKLINKTKLKKTKILYKSFKKGPKHELFHKLQVFPEYEKNFDNCELEFEENPKLFKKLYK